MNHSLASSIYLLPRLYPSYFFFFFNDTATTEIYTLSLHDALPIFGEMAPAPPVADACTDHRALAANSLSTRSWNFTRFAGSDRKSTRLNSSHTVISYAVFCLKKKKKDTNNQLMHLAERALRITWTA